ELTMPQTAATDTPNEATIAAHARPPEIDLGSRFPRKALARNPTNGSNGINSSILVSAAAARERPVQRPLPVQWRERVGVQHLAVAEERDDQRQADRGPGPRLRHHQEGDDLPVDGAELSPDRDERQVDGVEHDL